MSASKLAVEIADEFKLGEYVEPALDEMALRVFEDTRERAAKIAADAIAPNRRDIADAIRAMQPEPATADVTTQRDSPAEPQTNAGRDPVEP